MSLLSMVRQRFTLLDREPHGNEYRKGTLREI